MKKIALALAVVIGLGLAGMGSSEAEAAGPFGLRIGGGGLHISGGGMHVDLGRVHHGSRGYGGVSYYRGRHYGGHYDYHNTTHYDYHPGQVIRHRNHIRLRARPL